MKRMWRLVLLLLLLVACAPTDTPAPTPTVATIGAPTTTIVPTDSTAVGVQESPQGQPSAVVYGRTDEGAYFHGAPDAPVTLIDYSDFL